MKKYLDSFLINIICAIVIVLSMLFSEKSLFENYNALDDIFYGIFCAIGGSFLGETIKVLVVRKHYNWKDLLIGSILGLILSFLIFYLV